VTVSITLFSLFQRLCLIASRLSVWTHSCVDGILQQMAYNRTIFVDQQCFIRVCLTTNIRRRQRLCFHWLLCEVVSYSILMLLFDGEMGTVVMTPFAFILTIACLHEPFIVAYLRMYVCIHTHICTPVFMSFWHRKLKCHELLRTCQYWQYGIHF